MEKCAGIVYPVIHTILGIISVFFNMIMTFSHDDHFMILIFTVPNIIIECNLMGIQLYRLITGNRDKYKNKYLIVSILAMLYHIINIICIAILYRLNFNKNQIDPRVFAVIYIVLHTFLVIVSTSDMIIPYCYESESYDSNNQEIVPGNTAAISA